MKIKNFLRPILLTMLFVIFLMPALYSQQNHEDPGGSSWYEDLNFWIGIGVGVLITIFGNRIGRWRGPKPPPIPNR